MQVESLKYPTAQMSSSTASACLAQKPLPGIVTEQPAFVTTYPLCVQVDVQHIVGADPLRGHMQQAKLYASQNLDDKSVHQTWISQKPSIGLLYAVSLVELYTVCEIWPRHLLLLRLGRLLDRCFAAGPFHQLSSCIYLCREQARAR